MCRCGSVEYRLAPEHPAPAAADDCLTVLRWVLAGCGGEPAAGLQPVADATRVALVGDSAGGQLTLVTGLRAVEAGLGAGLRLLLPLCPVVDMRGLAGQTAEAAMSLRGGSNAAFGGGGHLLTAERMAWFAGNYLGTAGAAAAAGAGAAAAGGAAAEPVSDADWLASPLLAPPGLLARLPPTVLCTGVVRARKTGTAASVPVI